MIRILDKKGDMPTELTVSIHNQELLERAKIALPNLSEFIEQMLAIRLGPPIQVTEEELLPETRKWMGAFREVGNQDLGASFRTHVTKKYGNE
ncbi:MAG: hypothetical protein AAF399_26935 [Bacteroidota bacterium]